MKNCMLKKSMGFVLALGLFLWATPSFATPFDGTTPWNITQHNDIYIPAGYDKDNRPLYNADPDLKQTEVSQWSIWRPHTSGPDSFATMLYGGDPWFTGTVSSTGLWKVDGPPFIPANPSYPGERPAISLWRPAPNVENVLRLYEVIDYGWMVKNTIDDGLLLIGNGMFRSTATMWIPAGPPGSGLGEGYFDPDGANVLVNQSFTGSPVPEPATMFLFGVGLAGFVVFRKKIRKA